MMTREEWLNEMVKKLHLMFEMKGYPLPEKLRVSCGWPHKGGLAKKKRRIGECWSPVASMDVTTEVFISPFLDNALEVAAVLVHELIHAAVGTRCGHKGDFKKLAVKMGLQGKMTATVAGEELAERLNVLCCEVGIYPHAQLDGLECPVKKQGTRLIKIVCPDCGYTCRTTQKWIEQGLPVCCCGNQMEVPA